MRFFQYIPFSVCKAPLNTNKPLCGDMTTTTWCKQFNKTQPFLSFKPNIRLPGVTCAVTSLQLCVVPLQANICLFAQTGRPSLVCVTFLCSPLLCIIPSPVSCFPGRLSWPQLPRRAEATEERKPEPPILMPRYLIHRHSGTPRFSVMQMERERPRIEGRFLNMKTKSCCQIPLLHPGDRFFFFFLCSFGCLSKKILIKKKHNKSTNPNLVSSKI